jgi:hypothetical protein
MILFSEVKGGPTARLASCCIKLLPKMELCYIYSSALDANDHMQALQCIVLSSC